MSHFNGHWVQGWLSRRFRNTANERLLGSGTIGTGYCLTCSLQFAVLTFRAQEVNLLTSSGYIG